MVEVKSYTTLLEITLMVLAKAEEELVYTDDNGNKFLINNRHLLDLFIAGVPSNSTIKELFLLSPALDQNAKLNLQQQLLFNIIRRFVLIFDALHDGVIIADENTVVRFLNKAFERVTKAKFDKIVGREVETVRPGKLSGVIKTGVPVFNSTRRFAGIDYITDIRPIRNINMNMGGITVARDITEMRQLQTQLSKYKEDYNDLLKRTNSYKAIYTFDDIIGADKELTRLKKIAQKVAPSKIPVLIRGESGTGKELFAHAIHLASDRANRPFVTVNCAAIPQNLLESELFGYAEGAFSGAKKGGKQGLMMLANTGTLFLDEIGDMNIELQAKLLRAINSGEIRLLGSEENANVDVRIIAATNADLEKRITEKRFREDLFYRLNVSQLLIPPLRERKGDILNTANYFIAKHFYNHSLAPLSLSKDTENIFLSFGWPGNVRELENTVIFIGNITEKAVISKDYLPPVFYAGTSLTRQAAPSDLKADTLRHSNIDAGEKRNIIFLLEKHGKTLKGKKAAANEMGISLATLYNKINIYGLK